MTPLGGSAEERPGRARGGGHAMRRPRTSYANVMATVAVVIAVGGGAAVAMADGSTEISACVRNDDAVNAGLVHLVPYGTTCQANEHPVTWAIEGPPGPAGSPDTPQQVLDKIVQVDGQGSGLDSSFV